MKENIKRPAGLTEEMVKAAEAVFVAMAYVESIRPTVEAYKAEVFAKFDFFPAEKLSERMGCDLKPNGAILHEKDCWLAMKTSDDQETLAPYWKALHERHLAEGFKVKEVGYCPLLMAEHSEREARWALTAAFRPFCESVAKIPVGKFIPYKIEKQMEELFLKIAQPFVRSTEELMKEFMTA
jgi:hypothetical protein